MIKHNTLKLLCNNIYSIIYSLKYSNIIKRDYVSFNLREIIETSESDLDAHGEAFPKCKLVGARYVSPFTKTTEKSIFSVLTWLLTRRPNPLKFPNVSNSIDLIPINKFDKDKVNNQEASFTWLGHASCYFQTDGLYFITDPIWSDRASPSQYFGPKRYIKPSVPLEDLKIDVVLLSHTHYDHLDYNTAKKIGNKALWIVPLGVKKILKSMGIDNCVELDWWSSQQLSTATGTDLKVVFLPAKHWTSRTPFDRNQCLWGGFAVITPNKRFYFAGDTAYSKVFKTIGEEYGPFDFSAIPIGAYKPQWFMKDFHCDPEEAVQIHLDVKSKQTAAIHWGTFPLADEEIIEPALELARARNLKNADNFFTMGHGETIILGDKPQYDMATLYPHLLDYYKKHYQQNDIINRKTKNTIINSNTPNLL